jgi:hypothetical protein
MGRKHLAKVFGYALWENGRHAGAQTYHFDVVDLIQCRQYLIQTRVREHQRVATREKDVTNALGGPDVIESHFDFVGHRQRVRIADCSLASAVAAVHRARIAYA